MNHKDLLRQIIEDHISPLNENDDYVTVATLYTEATNGFVKHVDINTALIKSSLLAKIKPSHINIAVNRTGVHYHENFEYNPSVWLYLSPLAGLKKAEPLVVSWTSGNFTSLLPDQGFLNTFDLVPRFTEEQCLWHDLSRPLYDVVINKPVTEYKFPNNTGAFVKIRSEYLKDYLSLRKRIAVQVFTIQSEIPFHKEIQDLFQGKSYHIQEIGQYEVRIQEFPHKTDTVHLEINGYRQLLQVDDNRSLMSPVITGHLWKDVDGWVDSFNAKHKSPFEYAYVSDDVLAKYESDDDYEISPKTGGVRYLNQWSVSYCDRVGRNGIKLELRKLYEGTPYEVIDHWNKFSIGQSEVGAGENVALKSERLIRKYFLFGRVIARLINKTGNFCFSAADIITLDEERIEYTGWSEFPEYKIISRHVSPMSFSREQFILRCKNLYELLGENLQERNLRKIINYLGFPQEETINFRSLKLMELLIKYFKIAHDSGLNPEIHQKKILERVPEYKEYTALSDLASLNSIRQLAAHKGGDNKAKLKSALKSLGIELNTVSNNYSHVSDQIYDRLGYYFDDLNLWLTNL